MFKCRLGKYWSVQRLKIPTELYIFYILSLIQFNSIQYFIFPIIKHKEYNIHVMSCAPVKEEFNYTVNYSSECFTMRSDSKKAELISLNLKGSSH